MKDRFRGIMFWIIGIFSMVFVYCLVYLCFRGNIGFSVGVGLEKSDWLSFCGDFLGFASSTLMAIVVFRQDKKINSLMKIEYDPILVFRVLDFKWLDAASVGTIFSRYNSLILGGQVLLCEQFVFEPINPPRELNIDCGTFQFCFSIANHGKLPVQSVVINKITFGNDICLYEKDVDSKLVELGKMQPGGIRYLCIKLNRFLRPRNSSVYKVRIDYTVNVTDDLIRSANFEFLVTGDETTVFDGMDYLRK